MFVKRIIRGKVFFKNGSNNFFIRNGWNKPKIVFRIKLFYTIFNKQKAVL
ncbi:MAG: hypothetical protein FD181_3470 [Prolixibacteraceae bacterium]|nr:MAG: hypothetical protein FD181_3470 [Prolixibacteraceae bacterium]